MTTRKQIRNTENTGATVIESPVEKPKKQREQRACECGCGGQTFSRFVPGHDQRHKGNLLRAAREGSAEAVAELERLGWSKFNKPTAQMLRKAERAAKAAQAEQTAASA